MAIDSPCDTPCGVGCPIRRSEDPRALAPPLGFSQRATSFIASRYQGIHQMPLSSSSPTPSPKHARLRAQRTDDRGQRTEALAPDLLVEPACRCICRSSSDRCFGCQGISLRSAGNHVSRRLFAYPCPGPAKTERPGLLHGHDSLHDFREQTTENRDQTSRSIVPRSRSRTRRSRRQRTRPRRTGSRLLSSVVCPLSSEPGGPGPTRTADLTLIRRAL
jgi:hypothetical protein